MCHAPADLFRIVDRGYLDEGMFADVVIVDPDRMNTIKNEDVRYKCGWTPLNGMDFKGEIEEVFVNGVHKYSQRNIINETVGQRLTFA